MLRNPINLEFEDKDLAKRNIMDMKPV
jgi:hypothetical protein